MQSENNKSENTSPSVSVETDSENHFSPKQLLRREATMPGESKNNLAWFIAGLCAFAGIGMGFGAGIGVGAMLQGSHCRHQVQVGTTNIHRSWMYAPKLDQIPKTTWLGVEGRSVSGVSGALVLKVFPHSPAAAAGLHRGDIIRQVNDTRIYSFGDLKDAVQMHKKGDVVKLFYKNGSIESMVRAELSEASTKQIKEFMQQSAVKAMPVGFPECGE